MSNGSGPAESPFFGYRTERPSVAGPGNLVHCLDKSELSHIARRLTSEQPPWFLLERGKPRARPAARQGVLSETTMTQTRPSTKSSNPVCHCTTSCANRNCTCGPRIPCQSDPCIGAQSFASETYPANPAPLSPPFFLGLVPS